MSEYIEQKGKKEASKSSFLSLVILISLIVMMAIFVSQMLFGKNSFEVYQNLKHDKQVLQKKIHKLQYENAQLQMQQFDLQSVLPINKDDL